LGDAITVGDPPIEVRVRRSSRATRMVLRLSRGARMTPVLTIPESVALGVAGAFARDQEAWIRRQLATAPRRLEVRAGARMPFRGAETQIVLQPFGPTVLRYGTLFVSGPEPVVAARVADFVREAARQRCVDAAGRHAGDLGRRHGRVTMRDTRSRWGSCTSMGDLSFSWRLALAPDEVLDYVVAHEVAHLKEMNHSQRFWSTVGDLCPDYRDRRDWLRRQGPALMAIDFGDARP
jgi:predicted metal-dependent hydrolase